VQLRDELSLEELEVDVNLGLAAGLLLLLAVLLGSLLRSIADDLLQDPDQNLLEHLPRKGDLVD
jgi:hypothetical protein